MHYDWTEEEIQFRRDVRDFLQEELPADWTERGDDDEGGRDDFEKRFARKLGERGWLAVGWPKEFGGLGWTPMQQFIFNEEMALNKAPSRLGGSGIGLGGPVIMKHGTQEQKTRYLPPLARGETVWCQLFSEPNAGSDLAGLETRVEDMGDYFLLNGQKTWTTIGHKAQYGVLLARSNPDVPKHKGISYFILDLSLPGVTRRPIINMADVHHFNEFFFDNVRVPRDAMIGEKDQGWYVTSTTLNFERSGIRLTVPALQLFEELAAFAREGSNGFKPLERSPVMRNKMAEMALELQVCRLLSYRVAWLQTYQEVSGREGNVSRLFAAELTQRLVQVGMELLGLWGQPTHESKLNVLHGKIQKLYRGQRAITIGGGTAEIQRNAIAVRGLGMPRG